MKFHKEGRKIIFIAFLLLVAVWFAIYWFLNYHIVTYIATGVLFFCWIMVLQFFRVPSRTPSQSLEQVICPADGKVVVIEEVEETEFLNKKCRQISIFMSPTNVHINWYPVSGKVIYQKYHPGKFLVAWHPKSSILNERTTVVVETESGSQILFRQIAGAVARRIVCYSKEGDHAEQSKEFGFIKFGSRVDVLLPLDAEINVNLDQKVKGSVTVLANLAK